VHDDERLNHRFEVAAGICEQECSALLSRFFSSLRAGRAESATLPAPAENSTLPAPAAPPENSAPAEPAPLAPAESAPLAPTSPASADDRGVPSP
jgi:hypothetical protein